MNGKVLLVLVLLVASLGAVLWFTDEKPPTRTVATTPVLDGRTLTECEWLRWRWRTRPPTEVGRRADGAFQITEPIVDLASAGRMKQLVDNWDLGQLQATAVTPDETGLRQSGLADPEVTFAAKWRDGHQVEVAIGGPGPLADKDTRYVLCHGKVWVGHTGLLESLRMGLDDLRERVVFRHLPQQASELQIDQTLASGQRELLHLRAQGGGFRLVSPIEGRADPELSQRLLAQVLSLRIDNFPVGRLTMPETPPTLVVTVRGDHGEETLQMWQREGQLLGFLSDRKLAFVCADGQYSSYFVDAVDRLRARVLVPLGDSVFEELAELVVDPGQGRGKRLRTARASVADEWRMIEPFDSPVADTPIAEAALALRQLVALQFVDERPPTGLRAEDPRFGLLPGERLTVSVRGLRDQQAITLWFGKDAEFPGVPARFACRSDEPDTVVLVPRASADTLARSFLEYPVRRLVKLTTPVERLDLERADGATRSFRLTDGQWRLHDAGPTLDRPEVGELAQDELRDLVGTATVDASGPEFAVPSFTIKLMRASGDEFGRLLVFDRGPEQPLLLQFATPDVRPAPLAFAIGSATKYSLSTRLRELWQ